LGQLSSNAQQITRQINGIHEQFAAYARARQVVTKGKRGHVGGPAWQDMLRSTDSAYEHINRRVGQVDQAMAQLGRQPIIDPVASAQYALLDTERKTLVELSSKLPGVDWTTTVRERVRDLEHLIADGAQIRKAAKELGVEKYLGSVLRRLAPGKNLDSLTEGQRKTLKKWLEPRKEFSKEADRFLRPDAEEKAYRAFRDGSFKVPSPAGSGQMVELNALGLDDQMTRVVANIIAPEKEGVLSAALSKFDVLNDFFRKMVTAQMVPGLPIPRAAFFARNTVDLIVRTFMGYGMGGFNPSVLRKTWQIMRAGDNVEKLKNLKMTIRDVEYTGQELLELFKKSGHWSKSYRRLDVEPTKNIDRVLERMEQALLPQQVRIAQRISDAFQKISPQRLGSGMETGAALNAFLSGMQSGDPVHQVIERMGQFLFYYGNLAPMDVAFGRRIFPFWAFERQALSLMGWSAMKRPRIFNYLERFQDTASLSPKEEALLPEWIREYPWVEMKRIPNGIRIASMRNVFSTDVLPDVMPKNWKDVLSRVNPLITILPEFALGKDIYFGREITGRRLVHPQLSSPTFKEFLPFLNPKDVTINGKDFTAVDAGRYHAIRRLWFSRLFRELDTIASVGGGHLPPESLSAVFFGFKSMDIDWDRQYDFVQTAAREAKRRYDRAVKQGDTVGAQQVLDEMRME
jgi:hypothetical protein